MAFTQPGPIPAPTPVPAPAVSPPPSLNVPAAAAPSGWVSGEIIGAVLNAIPSGWGTSEAKVIVGVIGFVGLLVTLFDILVAAGTLSNVPGTWVGGVDGGYAAVAAYVAANYAQARTAVKTAALNAVAPPASTPGP